MMKKIVVFICFLMFLQISLFAQTEEILTNQSIVDLIGLRYEDEVVVAKIKNSDVEFDMSDGAVRNLKDNNVSVDIIKAMHNRQTQAQFDFVTKNSIHNNNPIKSKKPVYKNSPPRSILTASSGFNTSSFIVSNIDNRIASRISYRVGIMYQTCILKSNPLYLGFGIFLLNKGADFESGFFDENISVEITYLQVPLTLSYDIKIANNFYILPSIGIYYNYGLTGNVNSYIFGGNIHGSDMFSEEGAGFHNRDLGLGIGLGFTYRKFTLNFNYEQGLLNIKKYGEENIKNISFSVSLEYNMYFKTKYYR